MGDPLCEQSEHHDHPPKSTILVDLYLKLNALATSLLT